MHATLLLWGAAARYPEAGRMVPFGMAAARSPIVRPQPFAHGAIISLAIDAMTSTGDGVGRVVLPDDGGLWVVMVPFVMPGERVRVKVIQNHKRHSSARVVEILEPSPDRQQPACLLFGLCGGCTYQHARYATQLSWKAAQVANILERIGRLEPAFIETVVQPTIGSPKQLAYRSKLTPHVHGGAMGFVASEDPAMLVDVPRCELATEPINDALVEERGHYLSSGNVPSLADTLLLRHTDRDGVVTDPSTPITEQVNGLKLTFSAGDFFQNNLFLLPALVDYVLDQALGAALGESGGTDGSPTPSPIENLIDAYCGSGLFALSAAASPRHSVRSVVGVEVMESAVEAARKNAEANGLTNVRFLAASAERIFEELLFDGRDAALIIDPPRKGCGTAFLSQLVRFAPRRLVYVSCSPDTMARDLIELLGAGYSLRRCQPFDMFPQTRHIECVATLEWPESGSPPERPRTRRIESLNVPNVR
jgi:tRNA/tmRNA/rRNA uracil-C5-methylase (TrmA/RlmC/RlmD family)